MIKNSHFVNPMHYMEPDLKIKDTKSKDSQLKELSKEFEAIFIDMVFKQMKKTVPKDGFLEESSEREIWDELLTTEMSQKLSKSGGIGLADKLYKQLKVLNHYSD